MNLRRPLPGPAFRALSLVLLASCQTTGQDSRAAQTRESAPQELEGFEEFDEFGDFEDEGQSEVYDPLSGYNRAMFGFNDWFFLNVWNPIAKGYRWVLPEPVRVSVDRFFTNLVTPARLVNSLLQGKLSKAGMETGRFVVNTTIGIGGLFDPADSYLGWRAPSPEDFGQTLATYGVGAGFPIVLPFLGPSNLRDGLGRIPDGYLNPVIYFVDSPEDVAVWVTDELNYTSLHVGEYESLKADALDPYTLFRDAYHQNRLEKIEE